MKRRLALGSLAAGLTAPAVFGLAGCGGGGGAHQAATPAPSNRRTWRMGFSFVAPRPDSALVIRGIDQWSQRAELALIHEAPPWQALLAGQSPESWIAANRSKLVQYLRGKNLKVVWMHDLTNGLDRAKEEPQLTQAKRSLTEPAIQQLLREYVVAVAGMLNPDYTGLAAETNLIRLLAPPDVYLAVVKAASACAADLQRAGYANPLMVSVQAEAAWGWLSGLGFTGMARDVADFPFVQMWGVSSYPYFLYSHPVQMPADYYSRLMAGSQLPVMVTEGGWPSASVGNVDSSAAAQTAYLGKQAQLLDSVQAAGVLQILYGDLDLDALPLQYRSSNLVYFGALGVVDCNFNAKPALTVWDANFARPTAF